MNRLIYILLFYLFCVGNKYEPVFAKGVDRPPAIMYYMDHGNIVVVEGKNTRLTFNKKEQYGDFAGIDPETKELALCPVSHITKDKVSVERSYRDPKTKKTLSEHYFDCKMQPTLRHGYHQAHYQYYSLFPKKKASKSFKGTQGQATTLFEGDVAKCEYIYPLLFPHFCFIFFFGTDGQQVDLIQKNVKIRAIFYDFTPEFDIERLFPKNMMMYYSEGDMSFFQNFTRDQQDIFFDALL